MQENMWLSNQEKSARILLVIILAILDQMRTLFFGLDAMQSYSHVSYSESYL